MAEKKWIKMPSASEVLKKVQKKVGVRRGPDEVYNEHTLREIKASTYTLTLDAVIMNSEWDGRLPKDITKILHGRFLSHLETIFGE